MTEQNITTEHRPEDRRYIITVDGEQAGFVDYLEADGVRDFNHTVVDPAFRGQGLSAPLVRAALDDTQEAGLKIVASCSAVDRFVQKNPEYADLLAR